MFGGILTLLIGAIGGFFILLFLARAYMQWARISFRSDLGQFVLTLTSWAVMPLRKIVPPLGSVDLASIVAAWLLASAMVLVQGLLRGAGVHVGATLVLGVFEVLDTAVWLVIIVVLISVVMSWVSPHAPAAGVFHALAEPFLRPFRRFVPTVANIDLSPLVLLLALQVLLFVLDHARASALRTLVG